jgi:hypothetical protein
MLPVLEGADVSEHLADAAEARPLEVVLLRVDGRAQVPVGDGCRERLGTICLLCPLDEEQAYPLLDRREGTFKTSWAHGYSSCAFAGRITFAVISGVPVMAQV